MRVGLTRSLVRSLHLHRTMARPVQDSWQLPVRAPEHAAPVLKVYNSLTRTKTEFITKKAGVVSWYNCGPTVYDASHMGHARNYMTQDIMRRILRDYFGYDVQFVMNITDVDDKIIIRARQSHLFANYVKSAATAPMPLSPALLGEVQTAWAAYFFKALAPSLAAPLPGDSWVDAQTGWSEILGKEKETAWIDAQKARDEKWGMHVAAMRAGLEGLAVAEVSIKTGRTCAADATALLESNKDGVSLWLDKKLGATVTDPAIFRDLAAYWEGSFFDSMKALHVEPPTTLTRVSEYIPEIVTFVEGIVERGLAYEAEGSVWFDTTKFEGAVGCAGDEGWKHTYAKLQPWSKGNRELLEDGEGSLTTTMGKRSASDFALWKMSKPGEPHWVSPWGQGRPGWHIECSVMASAVLGPGMDVHSGGEDLAFPHHDNEIAQSEAFHNCRQWVNYFLHTGHLHIEGLKMSKSLKNFITIDDALKRYTARQLRLAFLTQTWSSRLDFKESTMQDMRNAEDALNNFFVKAKALISEAQASAGVSDGRHHYEQAEVDLAAALETAQIHFRAALCDSFDTSKGLYTLLDLVSVANVYLNRGRSNVNIPAVAAVEEWVTRMLRMLGLGEGSPTDANGIRSVGWGTAPVAGQADSSDRETILMPYLRSLSTFRDSVRRLAMAGASAQELLALSDQFRDIDCTDLGIALDDQEDGQALVKLVAPETLRRARDEKAAAVLDKASRKAAAAVADEAKRLEKLEKGRMPPTEMFKQDPEYSEWDAQGLPTKDKEGVELAKSKGKKLKKEWDMQTKLHQAFLAATREA